MPGSVHRWPALCLAAITAAMLSACNAAGGGGAGTSPNNVLPPASQVENSLAPQARFSPINIYPGEVVGEPDIFRPHQGDTKDGGHGSRVDGIPCDKTEYLDDYHVHIYLGIVYEGKQISVPDAIGLIHPGRKVNGYISTAGCFYFIHTHDASGMVHIEDPRDYPPTAVLYPFRDVLAVWGEKVAIDGFGPFKGLVRVFVGNVPKIGDLTVTSYSEIREPDLNSLMIHSHEAIWLVIGRPYVKASQLPSVTFYTEY